MKPYGQKDNLERQGISGRQNYNSKFKIFYLLGMVFCLCNYNFSFAAQSNAGQQDLKNKIDGLRNQIRQYQDEIYTKEEKEETLQGDISNIGKIVAKIELQLAETELMIQSLDFEIADKQLEIDEMEKEVKAAQDILSRFLIEFYERGEATAVELALGSETFSDYFFQRDSLESFEERTGQIYDQYVTLRENLKKEKEELLERKEEQMNLRMMRKDQERALDEQKAMKNILLVRTRDEKQTLELQMGKLQEQLSALQSLGAPINLDSAIKAAQSASRLTGVAPEFLLGVLRIESGLGTNVGGGRYKTDMNPSQWDIFKKICKELKLDPEKMPVSRRVCYNSDAKDGCGGWGGAMGPAQFMPGTWMGYKVKVEKTTGSAPANPWDLQDSLTAMGLKLAAVEGVTAGSRKAWAKAAGMYLAGGAWENYSWYSDRVLSYADGYKKIMK